MGSSKQCISIEGRDKEDGAGECIWDVFAKEGRVYDNQNGDVACDHIHRYKEDIAMMRLLGSKGIPLFLKLGAADAGRNGACQRKSGCVVP